MHRLFSLAASTLAALAIACASPYVNRSGPLFPCDTSSDVYRPENPHGVCNWQLNRYRVLLSGMGYVPQGRLHETGRTTYRWAHRWADTSNVLLVEFAYSTEGSGTPGLNLPNRVVRISVSGRTFVESAGKRRHVRDAASLPHDVDYLTAQLREMFRRAKGSVDPSPA